MMKKIALAVLAAVAAVPAFATTTDTTWVATALTQGQTDLLAYVNAAVPYVFSVLVLVLAIGLIQRIFKKSAH